MEYAEISIDIGVLNDELTDIIVAELGDAGFESFYEQNSQLMAYIPASAYDETVIRQLAAQYDFTYSHKNIARQNWNAVWEANFNPVFIDNYCQIRAPFHSPAPGFQHEVIIEPKMSFGTGHHATTCLMIKLMKTIDLHGKTILDMGCGTGVLGIMAAKTGAKHIHGIDIDQWAVENTRENAEKNNIGHFTVEKGTAEQINGYFDVILANINRNILMQDMQTYAGHLHKNGYLIISGFYEEDARALEAVAARNKLEKITHQTGDKWLAMLFKAQ